jgi:hypothetical protein
MYIAGFFPGNLVLGEAAAYVVPSKNIVVTRMVYKLGTSAVLCQPGFGNVSLAFDGGGSIVTLAFGSNNTADSGPLAIPIQANLPLVLMITDQPLCPPVGGVANAAVSVEYVMQ